MWPSRLKKKQDKVQPTYKNVFFSTSLVHSLIAKVFDSSLKQYNKRS